MIVAAEGAIAPSTVLNPETDQVFWAVDNNQDGGVL